jgi:hypothetical protein
MRLPSTSEGGPARQRTRIQMNLADPAADRRSAIEMIDLQDSEPEIGGYSNGVHDVERPCGGATEFQRRQ